jgi:hypothetical protein
VIRTVEGLTEDTAIRTRSPFTVMGDAWPHVTTGETATPAPASVNCFNASRLGTMNPEPQNQMNR